MAEFLPKGKRIHLKLRKATLNRGGSSRQHNFQLECDLTEGDDTLTSMPEWIQNAFTNISRVGNLTEYQMFDVTFHDYVLECYGAAKGKTKLFPVIMKAKLFRFEMTRTGKEDEDVEVTLNFTALFDTTKQINDWVFDEDDTEFWMTTESPQMNLNMSGVQASDDNDGDEVEEALPITESQSARAARIRKEAAANASAAPPAARPAISFTRPTTTH